MLILAFSAIEQLLLPLMVYSVPLMVYSSHSAALQPFLQQQTCIFQGFRYKVIPPEVTLQFVALAECFAGRVGSWLKIR